MMTTLNERGAHPVSKAKVEIYKVMQKKELNRFIDFPHDLYADDPCYVPEIRMAIAEMLDPNKNPFFEHSSADLFLAYKAGKVVGRIAAIRNNNYNKFHQSNVGFFGFFDVIDDYAVAEALLKKAFKWNKEQGFSAVLGPVNFTTNDTAGLLVEGFSMPPSVQMTYNKPYYVDFVERYGLKKEMDMHAYWIPTAEADNKSVRLAERLKERLTRRGVSFRLINLKNFKEEAKKIKAVYTAAWEKSWGFVPPTDKEFEYMAEGLKMILDERYCYIAEAEGKVVGFAVGLPNINEILIKNKRGRLFPFGWFRLLWGKKKVTSLRIILLGVVEEFRKSGLEAVFFADFIQNAKKNGLRGGEASWILESNKMMQTAAQKLNGKPYKTYRIYSKGTGIK